MERLAHRKRRRLEAVAMRPVANLPHLEIEREVRGRAKLCSKNAASPRDARKNRVQADTFSSLSRIWA
jgi:hypothetical protein